MKRFYFLSIGGFYVLITLIAYSRPLFQKFLAEHQKQIEAELERAVAIEVSASPAAVPPQRPKVLVKSRRVSPLVRQVSARKGPVPEGSFLVHSKTPAGTGPANTTKKMEGPGNDPVS